MNLEWEEKIVKTFFNKRVQKRILYELSSPKKRRDAIGRLCHNSHKTLNDNYMIEIPTPNSNVNEIVGLLKKYGAGKECYCISLNKDIDGRHLPLNVAIENAVGFGLASLICISDKLAYFEEEQNAGPPKRFILKKD